jgi:hypothetical protein
VNQGVIGLRRVAKPPPLDSSNETPPWRPFTIRLSESQFERVFVEWNCFLAEPSMSLRSKTDVAGYRIIAFEHMVAAGGASNALGLTSRSILIAVT